MTLKRDELELVELASAPSNPAAGKDKLYFKTDGKLYNLTSSGVETELTASGSNATCNGRLTLASGTPVTTADQTAKTTVYFTPYLGNMIALYNGSTKWETLSFTEKSVTVPATTNTPFDIFAYNNAGVVTLETANWTNDTTRATALVSQDGVLVKSGATTRRYLGTGRTTGVSGQCEDSAGGTVSQTGGKRFLWNMYNRRPRVLAVKDFTDNWSYTTDTVRQANAAAGNKIEFVLGLSEDDVQAFLLAQLYVAGNTRAAKVGIGLDSVTAFSGFVQGGYTVSATALFSPVSATYRSYPSAGYHYMAWLEKGADGTCAFIGDNAGDGVQTGLSATTWG